MTFWARLTWQVPDPTGLAEDLRRRLGVAAEPGGLVVGALEISLGSAILELRPWRVESADDRPLATGRLVYEPVPGGEEAPAPSGQEAPARGAKPAAGSTGPRAPAPARPPLTLVGVGWATVELDRADAELDPWLAPRGGAGEGGAEDAEGTEPHLGGRSRRRGAGGLPAGSLLLLEPSTEGRLAAALARDGEGPCALYLGTREPLRAWVHTAHERDVPTSAVRRGPLGPSVLLLGGPIAGPHLILVGPTSTPAAPSSGSSATGTISA